MKRILYFFLISGLIITSNSCKKDNEVIITRDTYIGNYTGRLTVMVSADEETIQFHEFPETKTVEKGIADDEIIIGKGTDLEIIATVDGGIISIPPQNKQVLIENINTVITMTVSGQGTLSSSNELNINTSGTKEFDDKIYKWIIIDKLEKD